MFDFTIESAAAPPSYSTAPPSSPLPFGATLLSAMLMTSNAPVTEYQPHVWAFGNLYEDALPRSYSESTVMVLPNDAELLNALHKAYHDLASSQVELDVDAKRVLHSQRWDMYE
jgi:hypothetical protein